MTLILQSILNENYSYILVQTTIRQFVASKVSDESQTQQQVLDKNETPVIIELPFIGQEICRRGTQTNRGTQREYSSKPHKHSIVERTLVFKR